MKQRTPGTLLKHAIKKRRVSQTSKWLQLNRYIFWVKGGFVVPWAFPYTAKFVFCKMYNILILYFHIFQECFEVLKWQYFKLVCMSPLLSMCITTGTSVSNWIANFGFCFIFNVGSTLFQFWPGSILVDLLNK